MSSEDSGSAEKLPAILGGWTALAAIVGSVIGSGIFLVPARVASGVPFVGGIVLVWLVGGLFSAAGALTLAELGAMMPRAGGPYEYLKRGFGPLWGFLFSWAEFWVVRTGSMATLAAAFARYFSQLVPAPGGMDPRWWQTIVAVMAMAFVGAINVRGTKYGGRLQVAGTFLKVTALLTMIILPIALSKGTIANWSPLGPDASHTMSFAGFLAAIVAVLWAYDGWVNVTPLAEELTNPQKQLPRALAGGVAILIFLYLGTTLAYHAVLPLDSIRQASTDKGSPKVVAAEFWQVLVGPPGLIIISLIVMASTLISLNGNALTGPRAYYAVARDGYAPKWMERLNPRTGTPSASIIAQTAWAILLTTFTTVLLVADPPSGGMPGWLLAMWRKFNETPLYDVLFTYVIFGATVFYMMAAYTVFILRKREPGADRPFLVPLYPWTPIVFCAASLILLVSMLVESPVESISGLGLIAAGIPFYYGFQWSRKRG
jgi:amino acid transporter